MCLLGAVCIAALQASDVDSQVAKAAEEIHKWIKQPGLCVDANEIFDSLDPDIKVQVARQIDLVEAKEICAALKKNKTKGYLLSGGFTFLGVALPNLCCLMTGVYCLLGASDCCGDCLGRSPYVRLCKLRKNVAAVLEAERAGKEEKRA